MSKPAKQHWIDLAKQGGEMGREDCQEGWQRFAATLIPPPLTILDVGAGLGLSKQRLGADRTATQDPAYELAKCVDFSTNVQDLPSSSWDAATCFDVIEHVQEDITFLHHLKRIARQYIFITTPNYNVSKAVNGCHCREYTPQEFMELTRGIGRQLWIGNGYGHRPVQVSDDKFASHTMPHQAVMLNVTRGNLGRWGPWYKHIMPGAEPRAYGVSDAYRLGAEFLSPCNMIEDWGCGMGYLRTLLPPEKYRGIDGTHSPHADVVTDLADYISRTSGIFMRGVIEHDRRWHKILTNAIQSFTQRMVLVLFTPMSDETKEISFNEELGVPDISFALEDIAMYFAGLKWSTGYIKSDTGYGGETLFYLEK